MEYSSEPLTAHYLNKGHKYRTLRTTVIAPKISAGLSIVGSAYIVQDVLRNPNKRTKSIYHRLMVGLSIADILVSFFFWFLTSWPVREKVANQAYYDTAHCGVIIYAHCGVIIYDHFSSFPPHLHFSFSIDAKRILHTRIREFGNL